MVTIDDYTSNVPVTWCPGCGNFGILQALKEGLVALDIEPHQLLLVSGIGQGPKLPHYMQGNVFNGLHGRTLPVATGAKIANHELTVIGIDGDGGAYGEGIGHLLASIRRNVNITYLVHNNQVYGLTKGQASPTSDPGFITRTTPMGAGQPLNPVALAIASGAGFIGRGFAGDTDYLSGIIQEGIKYKGFALIDILQPCVSFNTKNTFQWYKDRVYRLDEDSSYDQKDRSKAFEKSTEWIDRIPTGIIYREEKPVYEEQLPALENGVLVNQPLEPTKFSGLIDEFM
ncbi:2-oxoacid:ferredoxin oxidoreductase subunit beta [Chloroflexota bacterium]